MSWDKIENHLFSKYDVEGEDKELSDLMEEHDKEVIDEFAKQLKEKAEEKVQSDLGGMYEMTYEKAYNNALFDMEDVVDIIAEQMKAGGIGE